MSQTGKPNGSTANTSSKGRKTKNSAGRDAEKKVELDEDADDLDNSEEDQDENASDEDILRNAGTKKIKRKLEKIKEQESNVGKTGKKRKLNSEESGNELDMEGNLNSADDEQEDEDEDDDDDGLGGARDGRGADTASGGLRQPFTFGSDIPGGGPPTDLDGPVTGAGPVIPSPSMAAELNGYGEEKDKEMTVQADGSGPGKFSFETRWRELRKIEPEQIELERIGKKERFKILIYKKWLEKNFEKVPWQSLRSKARGTDITYEMMGTEDK
jgi:hypothetical protein